MDEYTRGLERKLAGDPADVERAKLLFRTGKRNGEITQVCGRWLYFDQIVALENLAQQYRMPLKEFAKNQEGRSVLHSDWGYLTYIKTPTKPPQNQTLTIPETLTQLYALVCNNNQLTTLNIPPTLTKLEILSCYENQLTTLAIPPTFTRLRELYCSDNQLTTLNIPPTLTKLVYLNCWENQLTTLIIPPTVTQLESLYCRDNPLTTLTLPPDFEKRGGHVHR